MLTDIAEEQRERAGVDVRKAQEVHKGVLEFNLPAPMW